MTKIYLSYIFVADKVDITKIDISIEFKFLFFSNYNEHLYSKEKIQT